MIIQRTLTWLTLAFVLSIVIAGCGSNNQGSAPSSTSESESGPVKLAVFAPQGANSDLATNSFTKLAEEEFGIDFEWQTTTWDSASAKEKRQISLASGDYPDLYLLIPWVDQFSQTELIRYGKQGVLVPLNDLIEQHAPNIKAALEKHSYFKAMATAPDGNIYGLPQLIECFHCSWPNKLWINTDWLEKVGLEMPTTTEEFAAVLKAFKTQDPNGNGQADEVPLSGSTEEYGVRIIPYLMNGFIYNDDRTYLLLKDGKADLAANKPEWKEGLSYIKSLYDDKLIDPGAFTQNAEALKSLGDHAGAQILGASAAMHPGIFVSVGTESAKSYDPAPPLQGPHATYATYNYPSAPGATFVLTHKASEEEQIAAIKLLDYMFTQEGQIRAHFGEEDLDWRKPQEGDVAIAEEATPILAQIPLKEGEQPHNSSWGPLAQYYHPREFRDGWVQAMDIYSSAGYERRLQEATYLYENKQPEEVFPHWATWLDPEVADEAATLKTNILNYVDQNALQFITGEKSLDADWDAYVAGFEQLGLPRYLEIMQQAYDRSVQK